MAGAPGSDGPAMWTGTPSRLHRYLPSVWVAFLALPIALELQAHHSILHRVVVIAISLAFGALFVWDTSRFMGHSDAITGVERWVRVPLFLAVPVFLCCFDDSNWVYTFVYSMFPIMRVVDQPRRRYVVGAVTGVALVTGLATGADGGNLFAAMCVILGTGGSWLAFGRIIGANQALREAQESRAQAAVAEERLRFARDLHDLLGHSLSVIALKSEVAGRLVDARPERARAEVAEIEQVARRALREVREAVGGYRQATLAVELASARSALAAGGVTWEEDVDEPVDVADDVEAVLAWAVREGVTNLLRHGHATSCSVVVRSGGEVAEVLVTDDGVGTAGAAVPGSGLSGLAERAAAVGGDVDTGPADDGTGFRLRVTVPAAGPPQPAPPVERSAAS